MKWSECTVYPLYQIYFWLAEVMVEESVGLDGVLDWTGFRQLAISLPITAPYSTCNVQHIIL